MASVMFCKYFTYSSSEEDKETDHSGHFKTITNLKLLRKKKKIFLHNILKKDKIKTNYQFEIIII